MSRDATIRWGRRGYWGLVVFLLVIALVPQADAPIGTPNDKVNHILAFFTLAVFARLLWQRAPLVAPFLWLTLFGGLIEVLQHVMQLGRDGDWADFFADIAAIVAGLAMGGLLNRWRGADSSTE